MSNTVARRHPLSSPSESVPAIISQAPSVFNGAEHTTIEAEDASSAAESVRVEIGSLSARQAEVQQRIRHIRHALLELVHVFGPGILEAAGQPPKPRSQPLSRQGDKIIDLTRRVLSQSGQWLTHYELIELLRQHSGTVLARFINPGVAVSNALRILSRRGEVEVFQDERPAKWRWIGEPISGTNKSGSAL